MIDPKKYGTATEAAKATGKSRTTLIYAADRDEIESVKTQGGTLLIQIASAKKWSKNKSRDYTARKT